MTAPPVESRAALGSRFPRLAAHHQDISVIERHRGVPQRGVGIRPARVKSLSRGS